MADAGDDSNAYELLEIEITATEGEIKKAYRQKSLKVHPDRVRDACMPCVGGAERSLPFPVS